MARAVSYTHSFASVITEDQQRLALYFNDVLVGIAAGAGRQLGALNVEEAGKFGMKLEERFLGNNPKPHAFYRASVGSSVERIVYAYLLQKFPGVECLTSGGQTAGIYQARIGTADNIVTIIFAIEYTGSSSPHLPSVFKKSRPDIRLSLGAGTDGKYYEALYDLTSVGGIGHILKKGDNWLFKHSVAFVSEIIWTNEDILHQ
ncbi:MAG: hypothetical protein B7Z58_09220 [Acidiphilium sp. 37-64-53]|uniref:hypothetical protein n=1 Tax=Acidiphilium TaxID=522 RepID=UPI000BCDA77B|nr:MULTISPECIES: hypothetical protein [Acidiphilium]OYW02091.1 MAG: hypothetical protein B7Z58_09220 [Acidiphilium sp. 37-64-53]OZB26023.1 MAG: hypothetical protein B7X49_12795 [Acidiphilium sp. 34-64-41]HQT84665.1 hypothetical protein [Acidiphilium rubrum]